MEGSFRSKRRKWVRIAGNVLNIPSLYNLWMVLAETSTTYERLLDSSRVSGSVLDLGCSTSRLLDIWNPSFYFGIDLDCKAIAHAQSRFEELNRYWACGDALVFDELIKSRLGENDFRNFDHVVLFGFTHHLSDQSVLNLLESLRALLKNTRILIVDGVFTDEDSRRARFLLSNDRGEYVRHHSELSQMLQRNGFRVDSISHHRTSFFGITYELNEVLI